MGGNQNLNYVIRNMKESDFDGVRELYSSVNFTLFKYCNEVYYKTDPQGFFVAEDLATGKLLGVCSGVNLSPNLGFVGQYAVRPECEGKGIGSKLFTKVMEHIGDRNASLFAQECMIEKYRDRSGFKIVSQKRLLYYSGELNCDLLQKEVVGIKVTPISDDNIERVGQYDRQITGLDRKLIIEGLAKTNGNVTAVALNDNQVLGYCVFSVSTIDSFMIEPLYADNQDIAEVLINKCCQLLPSDATRKVVYHFWDCHPPSKAIADKMGLKFYNLNEPVLFTKESVEVDENKIFSVSNCTFYPF